MRRAFPMAAILWLLAAPNDAAGQIINTLRGFDTEEPGWSGQIEGAVALSEGNTDFLEFELNAGTQWISGRQRLRFLAHFLERSSEGATIAEDRMGHARHNYRFLPWLASVVFVQGQRDRFRRLETRLLAGVGARFDVVRTGGFSAAFGAAYMWENEEIADDEAGFTTDHRASLFVSLLGKPTSNVSLDVSSFYQPLLEDFRDARAFVSATARADITRQVYLLASYSLLHESNPPAGVEETDHSLRSGIGFKF